ncbi:MAG: polysaccharide deacetylase family protein [Chloroflexi bacterium]|nr:polysaccharide deacetylase family protein [Chloroflexota bacterium]MCL5076485.1 polysaccharide deacetylase family protein [Chloroflexota bacterium]
MRSKQRLVYLLILLLLSSSACLGPGPQKTTDQWGRATLKTERVYPTVISSPPLTPPPTAMITPTVSPPAVLSPTATIAITPIPTATSAVMATPTATPTALATPPAASPLRINPEAAPHQPAKTGVAVPILMYHHIAEADPAEAYRFELSVHPATFEAQLRYLAEHGYHSIYLDQLIAHLELAIPLPPKPIILTFDDGYKDNYTHAYPLLRKYGFVGTFFIISGLVGHKGYMSWTEIREMSQGGMSIESHSVTHPDLAVASDTVIQREVKESKAAIEREVGKPVRLLAYPSGRFNQRAITILQANGYRGAVSTLFGFNHSFPQVYALRRVRVSGKDSLAGFVSKLP